MFADPQTITVNTVAKTLPAVSRDTNSSTYSTDDGAYKLTISKAIGKRKRFNVRITATKTAADPLATANNLVYSMSAYLVIDAPLYGYSNSEQRDIARALADWITPAFLLKVVGGET